MVRRTDPKDDDWQNIKDAKKRKQIQDRLAQRARRQRLREAKAETIPKPQHNSDPLVRKGCSCDPLIDSHPHSVHEPNAADMGLDNVSPFDLLPLDAANLDLTWPYMDFDISSFDNSAIEIAEMPAMPPLNQPPPPLTVYAALYINGTILGLSCSACFASTSPMPSPGHPVALHPTDTQLLTVHPRWYDRLPFPKMRDTLIRLMGVIDEEQLLSDLFTIPSWIIDTTSSRGGGSESACWDTGAWKMEKEWAAKWGWMML